MSEPQKKKRINIPDRFDATDRELIAARVVERIIERTNSNIGSDGKRFQNYSDSYSKSLNFKIAGKAKNDPNLQLSGDMLLGGLGVLEHGPGYIMVGFEEGTPENDKAAWAEATDKSVRRLFLGVQDNELEIILAQVEATRPKSLSGLAKQEAIVKAIKPATKSIIDRLLSEYGVDTSEEN